MTTIINAADYFNSIKVQLILNQGGDIRRLGSISIP